MAVAWRSFRAWQADFETMDAQQFWAWFGEVSEDSTHLPLGTSLQPYLNLWLAARERFLRIAHFTRGLTDLQRQACISQGETLLQLVRDFWGHDADLMARVDAAVGANDEHNRRFGWPSPNWEAMAVDDYGQPIDNGQ